METSYAFSRRSRPTN